MTTIENATWENTLEFVPFITGGKVIKVYDCDTITIASNFPYSPALPESKIIYRFNIRLNNIDAPEIKSTNKDEKSIAQLAQKKLQDLILNKYVILKNTSNDKYGRILADVYIAESGMCINTWVLQNRFGVVYNGGSKISPKSWTQYHNNGKYD